MYIMTTIFYYIWILCLLALLIIQYKMVYYDFKHQDEPMETWEMIVSIIPFAPYIIMLLTGLYYLITILINRIFSK